MAIAFRLRSNRKQLGTKAMTLTEDILKQLPGDVLAGLRSADRHLTALRTNAVSVPTVVQQSQQTVGAVDWDVVVCGGTLGILIACALQTRGWRVAVIERGVLRGREQEWNISRSELEVFLHLNLLSAAELEQAIATEYNPARVSFLGGTEVWVKDVLNIGVDPVYLLETIKQRFLVAGGQLFEHTSFAGAVVHPDGVTVKSEVKSQSESFTCTTRLLLDAMGHFSPLVQQARQGQKPEGICLVVGSCAQGFPANDTGDLLLSFTPLRNHCQYFWEAFPARSGRTTYLFTYMDADPRQIGLETLFEEYLRLLPEYQGVELNQIRLQRALFGFFPSYQQSPLQFPWSRILPIGDSSGSQSPLSFGGFGATIRHLQRLTLGVHEALTTDQLSTQALGLLQPYQPNLSVTWLFQQAMRTRVEQNIPPEQINQLLAAVFQQMQKLGDRVLQPFLQDVVQFSALTQTLWQTAINHPILVLRVIPQVGLTALLNWLWHYLNLAAYSALAQFAAALQPRLKNLPAVPQYYYHRWVDAWLYGSGSD